MRKIPTRKEYWVLAGLILFLALVFLHPLLLEAFGKEHPDNCPLCSLIINAGAFLPTLFVLPLLVFLGYFLAIPLHKLASRFFLVSSGRAPPAVF